MVSRVVAALRRTDTTDGRPTLRGGPLKLPAWALLTDRTRALFRAEANVDEATWARGRGWALGLGIGAAHFYHATNPVLAAIGRHSIAEAIADHRRTA